MGELSMIKQRSLRLDLEAIESINLLCWRSYGVTGVAKHQSTKVCSWLMQLAHAVGAADATGSASTNAPVDDFGGASCWRLHTIHFDPSPWKEEKSKEEVEEEEEDESIPR
ncbi:GD16569 [Drosophila simulans]|uniref:GD16569 n=1 Tax=Drosophila simulans TaxID=7240 RepID=B4R305_DROSI|nr:GD16569 [Drosophila simulans]